MVPTVVKCLFIYIHFFDALAAERAILMQFASSVVKYNITVHTVILEYFNIKE